MRVLTLFIILITAANVSAQKHHSCSEYVYDNNDSANRRLEKRTYFNSKGKRLSEDEYFFIDGSGQYMRTNAPVKKTKYLYDGSGLILKINCDINIKEQKCFVSNNTETKFSYRKSSDTDTSIKKSISYHKYWDTPEWAASSIHFTDTLIHSYSYNALGVVIVDTVYKCGLIPYELGGEGHQMMGRDTTVIQFFYDLQGNKIETQSNYTFNGRAVLTRNTWKYKERNVMQEDEYELFTHKNDSSYTDKRERHNFQRLYNYENNDLAEKTEYKYPRRYSGLNTPVDTIKESYSYVKKDNKITSEVELVHPYGLSNPYHYYIHYSYGYYPEKRLETTSFHDNDEKFAQKTFLYIYK